MKLRLRLEFKKTPRNMWRAFVRTPDFDDKAIVQSATSYKDKNHLIGLMKEAGSFLASDEIAALEGQLVSLRGDLEVSQEAFAKRNAELASVESLVKDQEELLESRSSELTRARNNLTIAESELDRLRSSKWVRAAFWL